MQDILRQIDQSNMKQSLPEYRVGDTVRVMVRVREGSGKDERARLQAFEGVVIRRTGGGIHESFTVRRVTHGVGIERTFPIHSPVVDDVGVVRHGKVRRAKLYYLRNRVGRKARVREESRDIVVARQKAAHERVQATAGEAEAASAEAAAEPDSTTDSQE